MEWGTSGWCRTVEFNDIVSTEFLESSFDCTSSEAGEQGIVCLNDDSTLIGSSVKSNFGHWKLQPRLFF